MRKLKNGSIKRAIYNKLSSAKDSACLACGTVVDNAGDKFQASQRVIAKKVKKHPFKTLGFAMLATFILSKVI